MTPRHLAVVGATASGKSAIGMEIARRFSDFEVVVADSMQGYRGMDVGTAKPSDAEQAEIRHHLVDVLNPSEEFSLATFLESARAAVTDIEQRGCRALIVGGTGLYVQALADGYEIPGIYPDVRSELESKSSNELMELVEKLDPLAASRIESGNERRLLRALEVTIGSGRAFSSFGPNPALAVDASLLGVWLPRSLNAERIASRVDAMLHGGWPEEVERLLSGPPLSRTAAKAIGYSTLISAFRAGTDPLEVADEIVGSTKAFARRQRVWFRKDERIRWYGTADEPARLLPAVLADLPDLIGIQGGER